MTNNELKSIANRLSDVYIATPDDFTEQYITIIPDNISVRDGYVIGRLMDVYREAKQGGINADEARARQKIILERWFE